MRVLVVDDSLPRRRLLTALLGQAGDEILTRLDAERHALADRTEVTVPAAELNRLKDLSDHLGDTINKVLGGILSGADRPAPGGANDATGEAAASVRAAIRRINEVVHKMTRRDGPGMEMPPNLGSGMSAKSV